MNKVLITILAVLIIFNMFVNIKLLRSSAFTWQQKIYQALFIWFLPVLGAVVVQYFLREAEPLRPGSFADGNTNVDGIYGITDNSGGDGGVEIKAGHRNTQTETEKI